jgi:5-hydroxyisourate hydrolase-like protein (transthyretin family)
LTSSIRTPRTLLPFACILLCATSAFAGSITGTVTDRTTGKPSPGDTVAVINTAQSMDELTKVTSDAQGRFQATAPDGGQILLHVTHHGAEYFKSVPPGSSSVEIDVYDSAAKIDGISGEALVLRAETDTGGKLLNLAENFFVQNASTPPRTEFGGNTFDFYLPKGAVIMQTLASSPGGLPTNTEIKTIDAAGGHYAFTFPVRPGETRFQVVYTLPYNGKQAFSLKLTVPTSDVAVMLPKSMQFQGSAQFQPLNQDPNAQSYDDHNPLAAQPIQFSIAGSGQLPQEQQDAQGTSQGGSQQQASNGTRPGGGLGAPDDPNGTNDPWAKYKWLILGALGLALVVGAGVMLKAGQPIAAVAVDGAAPSAEASSLAAAQSSAYTTSAPAPTGPAVLLHALKDELFVLETDRLAGRLSEAEYAAHKAAFDVVLRRAMARSQAPPAASNE